jgi:hypothetical protein
VKIEKGDPVFVDHIYNGCELNGQFGIYLGERPPVGVMSVVNHTLYIPTLSPPLQIIDKALIDYLRKIG